MTESPAISSLRPGDHVSWVVGNDADRDGVLRAYVRSAVRENAKVACFVHATTPDETLRVLAEDGLDVAALTRTGQLAVRPATSVYLDAAGNFAPEAMLEFGLDACATAREEGYPGLRLIGDMGWAAGRTDQALEAYEVRANDVYALGYAVAVCLYDSRLFDADHLTRIACVHPGSVDTAAADDEHWAPLLRMHRSADGRHLRFDGETDVSNRGALTAVLDGFAPPSAGRAVAAPVTLDVTDLRFADIASVRHVVCTADRMGGMRIVGASPQLTRLLDFAGAEHVPGLVLETV